MLSRACSRVRVLRRRYATGEVAQTELSSAHLRMCVPESTAVTAEAVESLVAFLREQRTVCVISGAGLSTESGIPDYRSEKVGHFARTNYKPVLYHDFLNNEHLRRRYWARNYLAYSYFSSRLPNAAHLGVRRLQQLGKCTRVITQNVDGLHQKAGSEDVLELHGTAAKVVCIRCKTQTDRASFQKRLAEENHGWISDAEILRIDASRAADGSKSRFTVTITPDGDVQFSDAERTGRFRVPACASCGGVLRANVVFHGDNIPSEVREAANQYVDDCDALLVLGSSLTVQSAFRLVDRACAAHKRIAVVNIGPTRADQLLRDADCRNLKLPFRITQLLSETLRRFESTR